MKSFITSILIIFTLTISLAQPISTNITDAEKIYTLSLFWKEASYNFPNFDKLPTLNWDSAYAAAIPKVLATKTDYEYHRELKKFSALLNDGHSQINYPAFDNLSSGKRSFGKYKIDIREFDHKIMVVNTAEKTKDEIPIGSIITHINDIPVEKYIADSIVPYISTNSPHVKRLLAVTDLLKGLIGSSIKITITTPDGKSKAFNLIRELNNEPWVYDLIKDGYTEPLEFKQLNNDIAYVAINEFNEPIVSLFESHLNELQKCKGLIIDLRKNPGGGTEIELGVLNYLTTDSFAIQGYFKYRVLNSAKKAFAQDYLEQILPKLGLDTSSQEFKKLCQSKDFLDKYEYALHYKGRAYENIKTTYRLNTQKKPKLLMPLVVLIGPNTSCAPECFLIHLQYMNRATFIGQTTYGGAARSLEYTLPQGGFARIAPLRITYLDGSEFTGVGIKPHIEVIPTFEDFINKKDATLDKAIEYLIEKTEK